MSGRDESDRDEMGRIIDPETGIVLAGPGDRPAEVVEVEAEPAAGDAPVVEVEKAAAPKARTSRR